MARWARFQPTARMDATGAAEAGRRVNAFVGPGGVDCGHPVWPISR